MEKNSQKFASNWREKGSLLLTRNVGAQHNFIQRIHFCSRLFQVITSRSLNSTHEVLSEKDVEAKTKKSVLCQFVALWAHRKRAINLSSFVSMFWMGFGLESQFAPSTISPKLISLCCWFHTSLGLLIAVVLKVYWPHEVPFNGDWHVCSNRSSTITCSVGF